MCALMEVGLKIDVQMAIINLYALPIPTLLSYHCAAVRSLCATPTMPAVSLDSQDTVCRPRPSYAGGVL